ARRPPWNRAFEDDSAEGAEVRFGECDPLFFRHLRQAARKIGQADLAPLASKDVQERTESGADRSEQRKGQAMQHPGDGGGNSDQQGGRLYRASGGRTPAGTL